MNFAVGKVIEYQDNEGIILCNNNKYFFVKESVLNEIKLDDYVVFKPENSHAFFIQKIYLNEFNKEITNIKTIRSDL